MLCNGSYRNRDLRGETERIGWPIMFRWLQQLIRRWMERRYRTRKLNQDYRQYRQNKEALEKGDSL
ncbi:MAG: hypothetical protein JSW11_00515 [Candidatus Heimdallarchaeota archaeon]|nr:MAG: hypothetical protein JSW11_00515 [Candidatus Heimdallarchaeota archaeon]